MIQTIPALDYRLHEPHDQLLISAELYQHYDECMRLINPGHCKAEFVFQEGLGAKIRFWRDQDQHYAQLLADTIGDTEIVSVLVTRKDQLFHVVIALDEFGPYEYEDWRMQFARHAFVSVNAIAKLFQIEPTRAPAQEEG